MNHSDCSENQSECSVKWHCFHYALRTPFPPLGDGAEWSSAGVSEFAKCHVKESNIAAVLMAESCPFRDGR